MAFQVGERVFFQEHWSRNFVEGTITELYDNGGMRCNNCYFVNEEGIRTGRMVGEVGALAGEYFKNVRSLIDFIEARDYARVKEMKESIKNLNDLIAFPLSHCFCGEEYTDYDAIKAYKERAFEITGVHLGDFEEEMER